MKMSTLDCLRDRISYREKSKNDFEWAKQRCEYYDTSYVENSMKRFKTMQDNYRIYKGSPDKNNYKFLTNPVDPLITSTVPFVSYPIIDKVIKALHGEEIRRPLKPIVFALNQDSLSTRSRERLNLVKEYLYSNVFGEIDAQIQQQMQGAKSQEEAAKIQQQGEEQKKAMAPPEIETYMSKSFRLPEEMQAQHILTAKIKTDNVKHELDTALLQGLISAEGIVRISTKGKPKIENVHPLFFDFTKKHNSPFIHHGDRWSYSRYLTLAQIYDEYGYELSKKDMDKLDRVRNKFSSEDIYPNPSMYNWDYLEGIDNPFIWLDENFIRVSHHVFRSLMQIGYLTRINPETQEIEQLIVEEDYELNPLTDLMLEWEWLPELWEVTKIDIAEEPIYTCIGPVEGQFRDLEDPHNVTPPYLGVVYDIINPDDPKSITKNGTYWQELYDIVIHYFKLNLATNWGNIISLNVNTKPSDMTTGEWLHTAVTKKFLLVDLNKEGSNPAFDAQAMKAMNMSNQQELSGYIQVLGYIQKQCFEAMYYNESRLGITTPYQTATANQQDIMQSSTQTMPLFNLHRMLVQDVLTQYLEVWRRYYANHPEELAYFADDASVASLLVGGPVLDLKKLGVFVEVDNDSQQILELMKQKSNEIIMTTGGDLRLVLEVLTAKDPMELKVKIGRMMEDMEKKAQEAQQAAMQMEQEKMKALKDLQELKHAQAVELKQMEINAGMINTNIEANRFAAAQDIDQDKESDLVEIARMELEQKEKEMKSKEQIEKDKLAVEREKIRAMRENKGNK